MHLRVVKPRHAAKESYSVHQQIALDKGILEVWLSVCVCPLLN